LTDHFDPEPAGIFFAADSAITDAKGNTLLNGFRKIYTTYVQLWEPYFVGEFFRGYRAVYESTEVALAFAGSTLTAQHYLNSITEHLGNLRITCESLGGPMKYCVGLDCQSNPLQSPGAVWDEDTFPRSAFNGLLTADVIAHAVHHS